MSTNNSVHLDLRNFVKPGQVWTDLDSRNTDRGKTGRAKPKHRTVQIISLPTLSRPGVMKVLTAPKNPKSVGKLREFSLDKLVAFYGIN